LRRMVPSAPIAFHLLGWDLRNKDSVTSSKSVASNFNGLCNNIM